MTSSGIWLVVGSVTWFLMDGLWLMDLDYEVVVSLGTASFLAHLLALGTGERTPSTLAISAAETCWLTFNLLWLVDDFHDVAWALTSAKVLFFAGGALLLLGLALSQREGSAVAALRFRRLRTGNEAIGDET
jgi:hypothetical protein